MRPAHNPEGGFGREKRWRRVARQSRREDKCGANALGTIVPGAFAEGGFVRGDVRCNRKYCECTAYREGWISSGTALAVRRWRGVGCAALAIVKLR